MPSEPLRDLIRSKHPHRVTHEVILVHGFQSSLGSKSRSVECQRILKSWIASEARTVGDSVNVRVFAFDSQHILHNGMPAIHKAAIELCGSIAATEDPTSPLFRSVVNGDNGRSSRAAVIIAHGLGIWVVKKALASIKDDVNRIEPTGIFFFDVPRVRDPIVDISTRQVLNPYLHEFSKIFQMELGRGKLPSLMDGINTVDVDFHKFVIDTYGSYEEIRGQSSEGTSYTARSLCHNIWTSASPILTFEKSNIKDIVQHVGSLLRFCRLNTEIPVKKLGDLGLEEELSAVISGRGFHDPNRIPNISITAPEAPSSPDQGNSENTNAVADNPTEDPENMQSKHEPASAASDVAKPCEHCPSNGAGEISSDDDDDEGAGALLDQSDAAGSDAESSGTATTSNSGPKENSFIDGGATSKICHCPTKNVSVSAEKLPTPKEDGVAANATLKPPACHSKKKSSTSTDKSSNDHNEEESKKTGGPSSNPKECHAKIKRKPVANSGIAKGKEREYIHPLRMSPVHSSSEPRPPSEAPEEDLGEQDDGSGPVDYLRTVDKEFNFQEIISQRNQAAAEDDDFSLRDAIQKLEILKFHQKDNLRDDDPKISVTQREIVRSSLEYGWWDGLVIQKWEEKTVAEMEDRVLKAYQGLRQSLGPHHQQTMETLALLFTMGLPMVKLAEFPMVHIEAIQNMIKKKRTANLVEAAQPWRFLSTLGSDYKAAHKQHKGDLPTPR
ncbi:hypothetical protein ABKA04_008204 [Annulohypoxylon sp. FPYF3050]